MKVKCKMELISDVIFGNGMSVPGGEDISVNHDEKGFPFYPGSALKGIFREELENYLAWSGEEKNADHILEKIRFADFILSPVVRKAVEDQMGDVKLWQEVLEKFTYLRTFTSIGEDGVVKAGSLRSARCLIKGLIFYGELECAEEVKTYLEEVLPMIQYVGSMRTRGFGHVRVQICEEG